MSDRAGTWKTNIVGELSYLSFEPTPIPPDNPPLEHDTKMIDLLIKANKQLALLDGLSLRIPNTKPFISMCIRKEALLSSQIDGIQATLEDILNPLIEKSTNKNVTDVINYVRATEYAVVKLREMPLCNDLIKDCHAILMGRINSQDKNPGEFRQTQNWIGGQGSTLENALYIPPNLEDMKDAMYVLEHFINHEFIWTKHDALIQAALVHYQIEAIRPFLHGNGRIGRLLITLFLMERKVLANPVLYISYFLKKEYYEYQACMTEVRTKGDYEQWIKYFLIAIYESATDAIEMADKLVELHNRNTAVISRMKPKTNTVIRVLEYIESNPIVDIGKTAKDLNVSFNTASKAIMTLVKAKILVQTSKAFRGRTFLYKSYLDIFRSDA